MRNVGVLCAILATFPKDEMVETAIIWRQGLTGTPRSKGGGVRKRRDRKG